LRFAGIAQAPGAGSLREEGKVRTRDIGGTATTDEFADAIIANTN